MPTGTRGPRTMSRTGIRIVRFTPYPRPSSQYGGSCQGKRAATETESCSEGTDLDKAERDKNEVSLQGSIHRRIY